ncbi:uncharacterized protein BJ212DRAFT_1303710 [Suillus subaureus]|uniref:Uncharacterized protein n=1 Tax=Suillus subaureus TaxID=48587 RepID=A0A9P7DY23_9AGAM|nr:uncharacterized protein BJ212DRAFT_1303710 [Suillus subaureus]KAG1806193.1 hypothetical protein BJ212DRAFT_1303710 [Suillus subaureus]
MDGDVSYLMYLHYTVITQTLTIVDIHHDHSRGCGDTRNHSIDCHENDIKKFGCNAQLHYVRQLKETVMDQVSEYVPEVIGFVQGIIKNVISKVHIHYLISDIMPSESPREKGTGN